MKKNAAILAVTQMSEYIVPLIAIPFLIKVLGIEGYGMVALAQAFGYFVLMICDFGFNMTGSRSAALFRTDASALSKLFANVQLAKLMLFAAFVIFVAPIIYIGDYFENYSNIFMVSLMIPLGNILYPQWFLVGIEAVSKSSIVLVFFRIISLVFLYLFVHKSGDENIACFVMFSPQIVCGFLVIFFLLAKKIVYFVPPTINDAFLELINSRHAFYASASSSIFRMSNPLILGMVSNISQVAYYAIAEKITKVAQEAVRPIALVSYPKIATLANESKEQARAFMKRLLGILGLISISSSLFIFFTIDYFIDYVSESDGRNALPAIYLMLPAIPIGAMNLLFGGLSMIPFGQAKLFSRILIIAGIVNLIFSPILSSYYGGMGAAASFVLCELVLMLQLLFVHKSKSLFFESKK